MSPDSVPQADLERILSSARRLGVELDEADALQWLESYLQEWKGSILVVSHEPLGTALIYWAGGHLVLSGAIDHRATSGICGQNWNWQAFHRQ